MMKVKQTVRGGGVAHHCTFAVLFNEYEEEQLYLSGFTHERALYLLKARIVYAITRHAIFA